ncbi:ChuX/HutX family heme-like substrate-binding protein [Psychrobacter sp. I-STPA10]|uniref:ChuX/HutX family heme-like substrate-binding protein n=1 Tax=Psychrobacter sp. I-STPA10 TaxID=2585769 RepID=UPI001E2BD749|nr:ChuX/HutX family heme-like substrate-binding protein [Psychrobacter sp. I-STPA10]
MTELMNTLLGTSTKNDALWQTYQQQKAGDRMLFPTEGAEALGVSEFELLLASPHSQYMGRNYKEVLLQLEQFGQVESIVRNKLAVSEKQGVYENVKLGEKMGLALNVGGLDLRFFMWQWQYMLAVTDESKESYSIQFFDAQGNAIEKVFLRDLSAQNLQKWQALIQAEIKATEATDITLEAKQDKQLWQYKALDSEGLSTLHTQWLDMTDVHQFHFLLKKLALDRISSFCQAPEGMATKLDTTAVETLLLAVQQQQCPIMIFVGNTGMIQVQTGKVHHVKRMGDWLNILDKKQTNFTLHLKDKALAQLWCVKRPTKDGIVTAIEGFDAYGDSMVTFFGQRKEGEPEQEDWLNITTQLCATQAI